MLRRQCSELREDKAKKRALQGGRASGICRRVSLNLGLSTHMHMCEKKYQDCGKNTGKKVFGRVSFKEGVSVTTSQGGKMS